VHEGRDDLVASLSGAYVDEALRMMTGQPAVSVASVTNDRSVRLARCRQALRRFLT